jgi:hypothetical protein
LNNQPANRPTLGSASKPGKLRGVDDRATVTLLSDADTVLVFSWGDRFEGT